jgi:hypothetical protein
MADGGWNENGQLHHRGELHRLVESLVKERRFARLSPRLASQTVQASSHALAFPNRIQWETCTDWATAWTSTSAEEAVKRSGETCIGDHHWCGADKWLPGKQSDCQETGHREKPDKQRVQEMVSAIVGKAPSLPAAGLEAPGMAPGSFTDQQWHGWGKAGFQP